MARPKKTTNFIELAKQRYEELNVLIEDKRKETEQIKEEMKPIKTFLQSAGIIEKQRRGRREGKIRLREKPRLAKTGRVSSFNVSRTIHNLARNEENNFPCFELNRFLFFAGSLQFRKQRTADNFGKSLKIERRRDGWQDGQSGNPSPANGHRAPSLFPPGSFPGRISPIFGMFIKRGKRNFSSSALNRSGVPVGTGQVP